MSHAISLTVAFLALRLVRGWNQTGQKFAGEPDLVKVYLHTNPMLLWVLVGVTYVWLHRELVRGFGGLPMVVNVTFTSGLILAAFSFKLAFTSQDSPELVADLADALVDVTGDTSLVSRARAVFLGLGIGLVCIVGLVLVKKAPPPGASGETPPL